MLGLRLSLLLLMFLPLAWTIGFHGIPGDYCRNRKPSECCTDRQDDCAVELLGSTCYCDEACLTNEPGSNTPLDDCCPDYREVCLGERPPQADPPSPIKSCERDGVVIPAKQTRKFNCHECKCNKGELLCDEDECMIEKDTITWINRGGYTWRAANYTKYWGRRAREGLTLRTGAKSQSFAMHPIHLSPIPRLIPSHFDARSKPEWRDMISGIRDQGWCGASWAFSALAVMQDRLAIMTSGQLNKKFSPEQLVTCAGEPLDSCRAGGSIDRAWNYLRRIGVVGEECLPYESGETSRPSQCLVHHGDTKNLMCQQGELYKTEPAYRISSKVEDIQWEIMSNGPVQAVMRVTPELFMYAGGVYSCGGQSEEVPMGHALHAVRVVGWGQEQEDRQQPLKYWIVANSWGSDWGEEGYLRILRGTDECGIESLVLAVRPRLANMNYGN